jgi:hypothetical protein
MARERKRPAFVSLEGVAPMTFPSVTGSDFRASIDWARKQPRLLPMKILSYSKFALLYEKRPVIVDDRDGAFVGSHSEETPLTQPATVEINGVLLMSASPKSAAEAARINEKLKEAAEMLVCQ